MSKQTVVPNNKSGDQTSSCLYTEGFVKTVFKEKDVVAFKIEATSPYLFEIKEDDNVSSVKRQMLLLDEKRTIAHIKDENHSFTITQSDFNSILIVKANHMKVRLTVSVGGKNSDLNEPLHVIKFDVL